MLYGLAGNYSGGTFRYDPTDGSLQEWSSPFQYVPSPLQHLIANPTDGKIWVSAFLNGSTVVYDPAANTYTNTERLGQIEGWDWLNGVLYAGTYPTGSLKTFDPSMPIVAGVNPKTLFSLEPEHHQNRPLAVLATAERVYLGTTPGYGEYGGALSTYDFDGGVLTVRRNLVPDQTISSLVFSGETLFVGSSIEGGQGTDPKADQARLLAWDPETETTTAEYIPVPGAASISGLTIGPDGNIWGLAGGKLFVFDPRTKKVVATVTVGTGNDRAGALVLHPHGYFYGVSNGRLFRVDPFNKEVTVLVEDGVKRLTVASDATLYTLLRPEGQTNVTNLAKFVPPTDPCPDSDLRPTVYIGERDTRAPNRFLSYGCTLADRANA